ncbi:MAG TPA: DUF1398 domain-containing protein [Methylophilus sp.]
MESNIITHAARATLDGSMPFAEIVGKLIAAGVEYYHVDYVALHMTYYSAAGYSAAGDVIKTAIDYSDLPDVAADFDVNALKAAIVASQQHGQHYHDFSKRVMQAGVQGYFVFIRGKRVTYLGRAGDQHTEWFPGEKP